MKLVAAKCPNCGANIEVDKNSDKTECEYCHTKIAVDDAIAKYKVEVSGSVEVSNLPKALNLLKLGKRHYDDGEYSEAYKEYSKAIELDPDNIEAIFNMGICKALSTNYLKFDLEYATNGLKNALKLNPSTEEKDLMLATYCNTIVTLATFAVNFFNKQKASIEDVNDLNMRINLCLTSLEYGYSLINDNKELKTTYITTIITTIDGLLTPKSYENRYNGGSYFLKSKVPWKTKKALLEKRLYYQKLNMEINPDSKINEIKDLNGLKKNSAVFKIVKYFLYFYVFCTIILAFTLGKSPIWGILYIAIFVLMFSKIFAKVFKDKKKMGIIVLISAYFIFLFCLIVNSYPTFVINSYESTDKSMALAFNRKKVDLTVNKETKNYSFTYEEKDDYTLINISDYHFKYQTKGSQYLLCLLKDNKCSLYFTPTGSNADYITKE